jgi:hypothetical protein
MKVSELNNILQSKKVPEHWYAINGLKENAQCIRKCGIFRQSWEVFFFERGGKYSVFVTDSEDVAAEEFLNRILDDWEFHLKRKESQND